MAVSNSRTAEAGVLAVCRQASSIGLRGPAWKTPVVGTVNSRGVPDWRFFASGVTEKVPPIELTSSIQQDTLPVPAMVAWALATKKPAEAGVIAAITVGTPGDSEATVLA
jgi:hypothetical protein